MRTSCQRHLHQTNTKSACDASTFGIFIFLYFLDIIFWLLGYYFYLVAFFIVTVCDNRHMYENTISSLKWKTALKKNSNSDSGEILYEIVGRGRG